MGVFDTKKKKKQGDGPGGGAGVEFGGTDLVLPSIEGTMALINGAIASSDRAEKARTTKKVVKKTSGCGCGF